MIQECSRALKICKCLWNLCCGGVSDMLLLLPITFHCHYFIWGCMCSTDHFSLGDWTDIYHVIIIIKSEVSTFPIILFFRGCVPEMFVRSYHVTYCIYILKKNGILFSLLLCSLWRVQIVGYVLVRRSCAFVCTLHHLIIIIVQTYLTTLNLKIACQIYFVECVSKIKHIFSVIHYVVYGLCVFSLPIFLLLIEKIYNLSYRHQIGSMNYYPSFWIRSWNNGMRCMSLYILMHLSERHWWQ